MMLFEVNNLGIYNYTLILILLLPIISTIVSISRHIVGMKTLSLYAPIVLAYAFIEMSVNRVDESFDVLIGIRYGLLFFLLVLFVATGLYHLLRKFRVNYYSKMSLIFTGIASSVFIAYFMAAVLGDTALLDVNIFSIVLIAAISERLVARYARTDFRLTFFLGLETLSIALIGLLIFSIPKLQQLLIDAPWILIFVIIINLAVGSFKGLRLTEYFRFRSILDQDYSEDNT